MNLIAEYKTSKEALDYFNMFVVPFLTLASEEQIKDMEKQQKTYEDSDAQSDKTAVLLGNVAFDNALKQMSRWFS